MRGDVLEYNLETRNEAHQGGKDLIDESRLAIEDVDMGVGNLAVNE